MLLGKRPRPPMRRTTSMTEFALDLAAPPQPSDLPDHQHQQQAQQNDWLTRSHVAGSGTLSPRGIGGGGRNRRSSADMICTAPFLKACGLCKRRLGPGRDIYMYRGEVAFCSLECRQQLINQEEKKEKCSLSSIKSESQSIAAAAGADSASGSSNETIIAA